MSTAFTFKTFILLFLTSNIITAVENNSDAEALLALKSKFSDPSPLSSWNQNSQPCDTKAPWLGVQCDATSAIVGLNLDNLSLSGTIDVPALASLQSLRTLSISSNVFMGHIPPFNTLVQLTTLRFSLNAFTDTIPDNYFEKMVNLKKLDASNNQFSGAIPSSLSQCKLLKELRLGSNVFLGAIPNLDLPDLEIFDVSRNQLTGPIPGSLAKKFNESSFRDNSALCGPPLSNLCPDQSPPPPPPGITKKSTVVGGVVMAVMLFAVLLVLMVKLKPEPEFDTLGTNPRKGYGSRTDMC